MSTKEYQYIQFCKYSHINRIQNKSNKPKVIIEELNYAQEKCNLCNVNVDLICEHFINNHYEYCTYCPECGRGTLNLLLSGEKKPDKYPMSIYHYICKNCKNCKYLYVDKTDNFLDYEYVTYLQ